MLKNWCFDDAGELIPHLNREGEGATISCIDAPRDAISNAAF